MKTGYSLPCNIAQTLNLVGDRWSLLILHRLLMGYGTYKELQESLTGIPTNLLSSRLKTLQADGLVQSKLYQKHPPRYRYSLTQRGRDMEMVFNSLILWGEKHLPHCHKRLVHQSCGSKVEGCYYCSCCGVMVPPDDLELHGADE